MSVFFQLLSYRKSVRLPIPISTDFLPPLGVGISRFLNLYVFYSGSVTSAPPNLKLLFPDRRTLLNVLEDCKVSPDLRTAMATHNKIIKLGYGKYSSIVSSLVSVYISCDSLDIASKMLNETSCLDFDLTHANMIIASFMKIGDTEVAKRIFYEMPFKDVVSWNSIIGGYIQNACFKKAFNIFQEMLSSNIEPDVYTFASLLNGCARLGARDHAKWIHSLMIEKRIELNYILCSALIDMYSKCGKIETAKAIFRSAKRDNVSVWNSMINGLAIHGLAFDAISTFSTMVEENILPDSITFIGILTACSHCGLIEEGHKYFDLMGSHYLIHPQLEHYGAMVDLFGRAGLLKEAYEMIKLMPMQPDIVIWRAFLSACRIHKNSALGTVAVGNISALESGDYVLLSNIYSSIKEWDYAQRIRYTMKKKGVQKSKGKSWIELGGATHQFKAGDKSHPDMESIYKVLGRLIQRTKITGFIPMTDLVLMDITEEEKEENLNYHSEKLALAYGILKSSPATEIHISKNLRICPDCHYWIKTVSKLLKRVIIVRDRIRFHRFEGGYCTCGDYW